MKNFDVSTRTDVGQVPSQDQRGKIGSSCAREGLAPVEFALALPFLMLFMAMLIAFGYAASWKIRSEVVARNVGWRNRHPRWANFNVRAIEWPEPAGTGLYDGDPLDGLTADRVTQAPIIVGPLPQVNVDGNLLDLTRDVIIGNSQIIRSPPVLPRLGQFSYDTEIPFLDDFFTHSEMGISNYSRRIPILYQTDLDFILDAAAIVSAVVAIENNPSRHLLAALEEDPEFIAWYGTAPDFHPRVSRNNYRLDRDWVHRNRVENLLDSIDRLPQTMAAATISLYRAQLNSQPPPSANRRQELEQKIQALQAYLERLRERYQRRSSGPVASNVRLESP